MRADEDGSAIITAVLGQTVHRVRDLLPLLECMSRCPINSVCISTGEAIRFSSSAMAHLARCSELQPLLVRTSISDESVCMELRDAALFTSFVPDCLSRLLSITLYSVRLSAASLVASASAALLLATFALNGVEADCHPAVACAIVGGYCQQIENVSLAHRHTWRQVQAVDVVGAYQSAVAAARRSDGYRPFTQLSQLCIPMCWCTPPSVWHALLSLMRHATRLHCIVKLASNDPLIVSALSYLPLVRVLGAGCLYPLSFARLLISKDEQTVSTVRPLSRCGPQRTSRQPWSLTHSGAR